jgi:hydroxymethylpyrimidine/phosphomethylpyrimidine kinase
MKQRRTRQSAALTVAGSDSGGGAGIQADLKTFAALGVHGTCAITCVTAQNPNGVRGIQACRPELVRQQIEAVFESFRPAAVKTGMLYSAQLIKVVAESLATHRPVGLVLDPVMVASSGARLLQPSAIRALRRDLMPLATLVTPNLDEAATLLNRPLTSPEALRAAAREIHESFGCAALVKGGHLRGLSLALDFFYDGQDELMLEAPRITGVATHGTGCTYAAAIAGYLALGHRLASAVKKAKQFITDAIAHSARVGSHTVLSYFWK